MKYWLITTSPENYEVTSQRIFSLQGFKERHRNLVSKVRPGDRFVIYISGDQKFGGAIRCTEEPHYDDQTRVWVEEDELWPQRFRTEPLAVLPSEDAFDVRSVLDDLSFITEEQRKKGWGLAFHQSLREIPQEDYELVESEIRKVLAKREGLEKDGGRTEEEAKKAIMNLPLESNSLHDRIGEMLVTIGSKMGYNSFSRHKITPEHSEELDVAWLEGKNPRVAVEVQIGGDIHAALRRLEQAREFNYPKVIIATEEDQLRDLNNRLKFDSLRFWIDAWSIPGVLRLYESGQEFLDLYKKFVESRYKVPEQITMVR